MNDQLKPVAEVSHETFSSDGTSDIITCNLPIGTKLYAIPEGCVVVPGELLERICWPVVTGSDRHCHVEAVGELRALLGKDGGV
ncbi:hypothetical protein NNO07_18750 [Pseudomonas resinovorans]|uniref:Uncharacterized protein n=1 Tax=Metapseudomonas resinovorans TaxID=53412 RepID=A0ABT4Y965_METRE|nr:hypothetical protein [Pseudomonas resinovorans]MDA8485110.1 hypothetical protein [Pseudomonas resinovorans]